MLLGWIKYALRENHHQIHALSAVLLWLAIFFLVLSGELFFVKFLIFTFTCIYLGCGVAAFVNVILLKREDDIFSIHCVWFNLLTAGALSFLLRWL